MKNLLFLLPAAALLAGCAGNSSEKASTDSSDSTTLVAATADSASKKPSGPIADAATIIARKQVPVLCYHNIVDRKPKNLYEVTLQSFKSQMKALSDSGYKTITPDQYYNYLAYGAELPEKPVLITYDDTDEEQFSIAKMEMDKYGFKGVYFIMTITMGKPRYMNKEQVKQLADEGHIIGSHTWDHHRVDRLKDLNTIE